MIDPFDSEAHKKAFVASFNAWLKRIEESMLKRRLDIEMTLASIKKGN